MTENNIESVSAFLSRFADINIEDGQGNDGYYNFFASEYSADEIIEKVKAGIKADKIKAKFEKYTDHHGRQFSWSFGKERITLSERFEGDTEIGYIFFK